MLNAFIDRGYETSGLKRRETASGITLRFLASHSDDDTPALGSRAPDDGRLAPSRARYKSTWNALSRTRHDAFMHVQGSSEERAIRAAGRKTLKILESTTGIRASDQILEIGCGVGRVGEWLAPRCSKWVGCDVSANMLRHAARRLEDHANLELLEVSGNDLDPIPDSSFDLVYCTVVFMHLEEWDRYRYVQEAFRVLRPGGRIYVDNLNLDSTKGWSVFESLLAIPPGDRPAHISKASTRIELETYLRRAGFRQIRCRSRGLFVRAWAVK
jgi:ubiquinone/menaquinone biosynthesis C-methylase UbiE